MENQSKEVAESDSDSKEVKITEVLPKFLFIGQTEESEKINKYLKSQKDYQMIVLSKDEMDLIVGARIGKQKEQQVEDFLDDDIHKNRAKSLAMSIAERFNFEELSHYSLRAIKKESTLSWKKFNDMISTLDMFGFISWSEERTHIKIIIDKKEILSNKRREIQSTLDFAKGQILTYEKEAGEDIDKKKVEILKNNLKVNF